MRIFRKSLLVTEDLWATLMIILILAVVFFIISKFLSGTPAKIFPWS